MKSTKFKIGDKVRCVKSNKSFGTKGGGWIYLHEFTVGRISTSCGDGNHCFFPLNTGAGVFEYALKLVSIGDYEIF